MKITLNFAGIATPAQAQEYIKTALAFPEYYGKNLDALYDMLSTWDRGTRFVLRLPAAPQADMAAYLPRLTRVFQDAARDNRRIDVRVVE